jgi:Mg-chelatase subunit ChlD
MLRPLLTAFVVLLAGQSQAAPIAEGTVDEQQTYTVKDRQGDSAKISLSVAYRLWPLAGEPVKLCVARWKLEQVTIGGKVYYRDSFPDEIWKETTLYSAKVRINLLNVSKYGQIISFICDLGVMGPPDDRTVSFNSPGSPSWDEFLLLGSRISKQNNPYESNGLSKELAKEYSREAILRNKKHLWMIEQDSRKKSHWGMMELWQASINLWPLRRHLRDETKAANARTRGGAQARKQSPGNLAVDDSGITAPPDVPSRQDLLRRAGARKADQNRQSLEAVLDEIQKRKGSDNSLSLPNMDRKAPVSGVEVPHEPSTNNSDAALLLLVDTSGSMNGERISDAKKAAGDVIDDALRQNTEVAVLAFSGDCNDPVPMRHPFSDDATSLHRFVSRLSANGGTPMSAAVEYANRYMAINRSATGKSEMIILLADGDDNCAILSPVVKSLKKDGVLFRHQTVGLEIDSNSSAARDLRKLARDSDGDYQYAANSSQLNETFRRAMLAMEMLDMLGRFGEEKHSVPSNKNNTDPTQSILDGFDP